ncbi:MAG: LemA family protein [Dehalococcoidia bacterium]|nr:LemA family protein [Dehalococcoidia bacterium]
MELWTWGALAALVVLLGWAVWTFNTLVRRRNGVDESRATIGVELTRRHDLVPTLVEAVRGYADFESSVLTRVTDSRSRAVAAPDLDAPAEVALTDAVRSLFAVAEAYPDLQASEQFQRLQSELALTEDRIAYARAVYNAWVTDYETTRQSFPSSVVAALLRFTPRPYFEADVASRAPSTVRLAST